jgi:trimethylamine--corrinoid protein Co-methyltransferase
MTMGTIWDVPNADMYIHGFVEVIRGTDKPMVFTANDLRDIRHIWRIACAVAGGEEEFRQRPFLINYSEPISPLLFADDSVQKMLFCAEVGIPMAYIPSPNMGGGGTVTMAGALALGNAETLAGMVLTQLKRRGAPFLYGANVAVMDMRTMVVCYGSPEWSLSDIALADMARYYGLPVWGTGGATDSKVIDTQAGLEAMMSIYTAYLARLTLIHDVGYIESGLTSAMEMIVLGNEIIGMVRHVVEGMRVDAETLALDAIHNVVPGSGFMADEHTLNNWRSALYMPDLLDRQRYDRWEKKGSLDMAARLNRRAREILDSSEEKQLSEAVMTEIAAVLEERAE